MQVKSMPCVRLEKGRKIGRSRESHSRGFQYAFTIPAAERQVRVAGYDLDIAVSSFVIGYEAGLESPNCSDTYKNRSGEIWRN